MGRVIRRVQVVDVERTLPVNLDHRFSPGSGEVVHPSRQEVERARGQRLRLAVRLVPHPQEEGAAQHGEPLIA